MIEDWGNLPGGQTVQRITLQNDTLTARLISYGATLQDLRHVAHPFSLVLHRTDFVSYIDNRYYYGATVGRYANRIAGASAPMDGKKIDVDDNRGNLHLHGGSDGSSFRNWTVVSHSANHVTFADTLPDGHMGFPGALDVTCTYILDGDTLGYVIEAVTDASTWCNFTNHSYFNLDGGPTIAGHYLQVLCDRVTECDNATVLPTGRVIAAAEADLDYTSQRPLVTDGKIARIDHNYCLSDGRRRVTPVAVVTAPESGLSLEIATTEPGLQVYSGFGISEEHSDGRPPYVPFAGIALEPQIWPDSPNQPSFPSARLDPGKTYRHETRWRITQH